VGGQLQVPATIPPGKVGVSVASEAGWAPGFYVLFAEGICMFYMALIEQDRQCTYNVTLRRVRATTLVVAKQ